MRRLMLAVIVFVLLTPSFALMMPSTARAAYTPPAHKIAVVRSTASQAWVDKYNRGYGILTKQDRVFEWLGSQGWDVEQIGDADLSDLGKLKQYDAVVCMWVFAMSPTAANTLTRYVGEGGGLVTLYASPRVAPGVGGSELEDHWARILNYEGWEWGPLSEVNQTYFIDDFGAIKYRVNPVWGHPIISGAASILQARGFASGDMTLVRDPASWVELPRMLSGNKNTEQFMTMTALSTATGSNHYPGTHPGAVASKYLDGRCAYFYWSPTDMLPNFNQDGTANKTVSTGVKQGQIAAALIESAIGWAADSGGRPGVITRDGRTYAQLSVFQDGIYASQYTQNFGNVSVSGTLAFRVYDPAGRLVRKDVRYKIGVEPGASNRYSTSYTTGKLADGYYRVEVEYVTSYPTYGRTYVETAYVRRGAGTNIRTAYDSGRTSGQVVFDPRVDRYSGPDTYRTALALADAAGGYPRPGGYVIIASASGGADALVASSLCGAYDAPLVLTAKDSIPSTVDSWLRSSARGFDTAIIVGGTGVVSPAVENHLKTIFGAGDVKRLWGADRYGTAAAVARDVRTRLGASYEGGMVVAGGLALVDAAAASAVASGKTWPIVYVRQGSIPAATASVVSEISSGTVAPEAWIAGGTAVVGYTATAQLRQLVPGIVLKRAGGADRYDTAAKLADIAYADGASWAVTGMGSGKILPETMALGTMVGRANGVMLLTDGRALTSSTSARLTTHRSRIGSVVVGGGTSIANHDVTARISGILP